MHAFLTADGLVALATLAVLEIVLGVDNIIFLSILAAKVEPPLANTSLAWSSAYCPCISPSLST